MNSITGGVSGCAGPDLWGEGKKNTSKSKSLRLGAQNLMFPPAVLSDYEQSGEILQLAQIYWHGSLRAQDIDQPSWPHDSVISCSQTLPAVMSQLRLLPPADIHISLLMPSVCPHRLGEKPLSLDFMPTVSSCKPADSDWFCLNDTNTGLRTRFNRRTKSTTSDESELHIMSKKTFLRLASLPVGKLCIVITVPFASCDERHSGAWS